MKTHEVLKVNGTSLKASYLGYDNRKDGKLVVIEKEDGSRFFYKLSVLSSEDNEYLTQLEKHLAFHSMKNRKFTAKPVATYASKRLKLASSK